MTAPRTVLDLQRLAASLGYPVVTDGFTGTRTRGAWEAIRIAAELGSPGPRYEILVRAEARISTDFHAANDPRPGGRHDGIDLAELHGDPCEAAAAGVVLFAGEGRRADGSGDGYGLRVDLRHPSGEMTRYAHLSRIGVRVGQAVAAGEVLGAVGTTG